MYLNKEYIKEVFNEQILPKFCIYIHNNHYSLDEKELRGELFTKIRRHLPELTNPTTYGLTQNNIDYLGVNKDGIIVSLNFNVGYQSRQNGIREVVEVLNEIIKKLNFDYKQHLLNINMSTVVEKMEEYNRPPIPRIPDHLIN